MIEITLKNPKKTVTDLRNNTARMQAKVKDMLIGVLGSEEAAQAYIDRANKRR